MPFCAGLINWRAVGAAGAGLWASHIQPYGDAPMGDALVLMEGIDKSFRACTLDNCRFELQAGEGMPWWARTAREIDADEGAGRHLSKDAGRILYLGQEVEIDSPRAAQDLGISMIHQELNLMPHLTVAQNVFIGREPRHGAPFWLDERAINQETQKLFDMMHLRLDPRTKVADLTVAKQQMVEIAKALSFNSQALIMDEPTAALTEAEIDELFRIIRQLRNEGVGVVHISHRLEELKQISDRVTVMRDGRYIDTVQTQEASVESIISMMVGRTIYESSPELPENPTKMCCWRCAT